MSIRTVAEDGTMIANDFFKDALRERCSAAPWGFLTAGGLVSENKKTGQTTCTDVKPST